MALGRYRRLYLQRPYSW